MRLLSTLAAAVFAILAIFSVVAHKSQGDEVQDMMDSTVQIRVTLEGDITSPLAMEPRHVEGGALGSGVVYEKSGGGLGPVHSRILTAHHVLGDMKEGDKITKGEATLEVTSKRIEVITHGGQVCHAELIEDGDWMFGDVAVIEADCNAGRAAPIGSSMPADGEKVFVSGHPHGFPMAVVTEGLVSGFYHDWFVLSAACAPGNSGGPIFYKGEVVGILVRGHVEYPHISIGVTLDQILKRIDDARPMPDLWSRLRQKYHLHLPQR